MSQQLHERLKAARMAAGFAKAVHAAQKFDWNISTYRAHENGQNPFDLATGKIYADAFRVSLAWLSTGESVTSTKTTSQNNPESHFIHRVDTQARYSEDILTIGIVGEGFWLSRENLYFSDDKPKSPFPADPRYLASRQFDLKLLGNRALPYAREGEFIRCIRCENPEAELKNNDLVVIETHKNELVERKIRLLVHTSGGFVFANFDGFSDGEVFSLGQLPLENSIYLVGKILFKYEFSEFFSSIRLMFER